ncbi:F-box domain-containing protein [Mycena sanguinolenta]|uniref:F-box domain-containing protein n=1 Tax=Mycena sanguinolenta TaxID=230812 RepID=A0A8H6YI56_9AGAR|nr:F-box domain-containing protein [Mycena sanguinolenta]
MSSCPVHYSIESIQSDLRFNVVPDQAETLAIQASLIDAEKRLQKGLQDGTDVEWTEIPDMNHEHEELSLFIAYSSSRLAPIRRLHPEILSLIFSQSIFDFPLAIGRQTGFPVAAVSFHWRAVAIATPTLWSRFSLSLRGSDAAYHMLQLCLGRAKVSPLTIEIRKDTDHGHPVHRGIVERLIQTSDRWLRISFPLDHQLLPLFAPVRGRLSSLEIASFAFSSPPRSSQTPGETDPSLADIDVFEIAPKLCSLSFRNAPSDLPLFPLNQLERVLFTNIAKDTVLSTIVHSPRLRSVACHWLGRSPNLQMTLHLERPIVLAFLTTIDFNGDHQLLRHITAPNLESFSLTEMHQFSGPTVSDFIQRSQSPIRTLILDKVWARWTSIIEVFHLVPSLHSLTIVDGRPNSLTDMAVEALVIDPGKAEAILPNLRSFTLHGSYLFRTSKLLDMLESRLTPNAGPTQAQLHLIDLRLDQRQFAEDELERFRALKSNVEQFSLRRMEQKICIDII